MICSDIKFVFDTNSFNTSDGLPPRPQTQAAQPHADDEAFALDPSFAGADRWQPVMISVPACSHSHKRKQQQQRDQDWTPLEEEGRARTQSEAEGDADTQPSKAAKHEEQGPVGSPGTELEFAL